MNKEEFINELRSKLSILKEEEIDDIVSEYGEHIDEEIKSGKSETDAINEFGDIDELVSGILDAYKINDKYYNKTSVLDNIFDDAKNVFNKIIKIISNGTSKDIIRLLVYVAITILICYILKLPFYILETFVNKMFIGLPVSVYNIISRCSSILVYALYIMFVFVVVVKVLKEKVINNFDVKVETKKKNSKSKVKECVKKKENPVKESKSVFDVIFDIFKFMFKLFAGFMLFAVSICLFGFTVMLILSLYVYFKYNFSIGISIMSIGLIVGSIWLIYILYKYISNSKISSIVAIIMFCASIMLGGVGVGVFATEFNKLEFIDGHHEFELKDEKEYDTSVNYIECQRCENITKTIDNKLENNKYIVKIYSSDYFDAYCDNYYENYLYCGTRYPNYDFYKIILNDIKEKKFYNYDSFNTVRLEIIANEKTMSELNIKG